MLAELVSVENGVFAHYGKGTPYFWADLQLLPHGDSLAIFGYAPGPTLKVGIAQAPGLATPIVAGSTAINDTVGGASYGAQLCTVCPMGQGRWVVLTGRDGYVARVRLVEAGSSISFGPECVLIEAAYCRDEAGWRYGASGADGWNVVSPEDFAPGSPTLGAGEPRGFAIAPLDRSTFLVLGLGNARPHGGANRLAVMWRRFSIVQDQIAPDGPWRLLDTGLSPFGWGSFQHDGVYRLVGNTMHLLLGEHWIMVDVDASGASRIRRYARPMPSGGSSYAGFPYTSVTARGLLEVRGASSVAIYRQGAKIGQRPLPPGTELTRQPAHDHFQCHGEAAVMTGDVEDTSPNPALGFRANVRNFVVATGVSGASRHLWMNTYKGVANTGVFDAYYPGPNQDNMGQLVGRYVVAGSPVPNDRLYVWRVSPGDLASGAHEVRGYFT